jgi:hypothetical protein
MKLKEKQTDQEKTVVIDIKLTKGLVVALSCALTVVALLAYLTLTGKSAAASETEAAQAASTGMRQFYLTTSTLQGNQALTACAPGYHMASLWEIADPSNLKYNTSLGAVWDDSGQGPPSFESGWVRTGYQSNTGDTPGQANCALWTSSSGNGTAAMLHDDWTGGYQNMGVWTVYASSCSSYPHVWCIED